MEFSGYIALFAAIIVSRIINERGYRVLSDEEKVRLMDGFSKARAYSLIPLLILIGGYYFLMTKSDLNRGMLSIGYFVLLIGFVVIRSVMNHKKMKTLDLPDSYRRMFTISQVVSLIGVAWFFYALFGTKLRPASTDVTAHSEGRTSAWRAMADPPRIRITHPNSNHFPASSARSRSAAPHA
ncbi:MAG: hypothetical protein AAGA58_03600 [Verrucomicrobiota bacterium]